MSFSDKQLVSFVYESPSQEPQRLDKVVFEYLNATFPEWNLSRSQIQKLIESGAVRVANNQVKRGGSEVRVGSKLEVTISEPKPAATLLAYDHNLDILFEDEDLIVVNKPAGLTVHPGAGNRQRTLVNALIGHFSKRNDTAHQSDQRELATHSPDRPGIVHRLDKDTSGILVVAKKVGVHNALSKQFAARTVKRSYIALALSSPRSKRPIDINDQGTIDRAIIRHPEKRTLFAVAEDGAEGSRKAVTHWQVLERLSYGVLLHVKLETGRTHQIRVHLYSQGSPVVGDPSYGDWSVFPPHLRAAVTKFGRQALHAAELGFEHPRTKRQMSFESSIPADFEHLLNEFRGFKV